MKILYVTSSVSRNTGGIFDVVKNLSKELTQKGNQVTVEAFEDSNTFNDIESWYPIVPTSYKFSITNIFKNKSFLKNLRKSNADVGHIHFFWSFTSISLFFWSKLENKPYIVTSNGMLFEWALSNSKWKKLIALRIIFNRILKNASCIHVNTMNEYVAIRDLGLKNPVCIINNGVSLPDLTMKRNPPWMDIKFAKDKKILLYLSRIHQKKGVHLLVEAWGKLIEENQFVNKEWHLVIVGFTFENDKYENDILDLIKSNNLKQSISTLSGQYSADMDSCYANSDAFVLPSFSEGVPIAVLTAWAFGVPTIITPECNLSEGYENNAAIKIQTNIESIKEGISHFINLPDANTKSMQLASRNLAETKFSWKVMAEKLERVYAWSLNSSNEVPEEIIQDSHFNQLPTSAMVYK